MIPLAVLEETSNLIENGWTRLVFKENRDNKVCHCILSAVDHAAREVYNKLDKETQSDLSTDIVSNKAVELLMVTLEDGYGYPPSTFDRCYGRDSLVRWNDFPLRQKQDVLDLLKKTIETLGD